MLVPISTVLVAVLFVGQAVPKWRQKFKYNVEGTDTASRPTSKLHSSDAASNNYLLKTSNYASKINFFKQILVYLIFFV